MSLPTLSAKQISAAYDAIDPVFLDTPLLSHPRADDQLGFSLLAKVETLNPIRSFKGRGAEWLLQCLPDDGLALVTASAGNFGQGVAYAAAKRDRGVVIFAAENANPLKVEAMRRLGAEVVLRGRDFDAAKAAARDFAEERGLTFVEDSAHPATAEGAGTIALEITRELFRRGAGIDAILVPLGNGAMLTGIGAWMRAHASSCRVIGVVASLAPTMMTSWRAGRALPTETASTIADGIAIREPTPYALECMKTTVDEVWEISDDVIIEAMRFCRDSYGVILEPAGAVGVAAAMTRRAELAGLRVAAVLCGGNLTEDQRRLYLSD